MSIEVSEEAGVRYLHFGSHWIQGAMRIARPWSLELAYTRDLMFPLLLRDRDDYPRSALLIGLGAGSLPKFLHRHRPAARICVMEIDATVVDAARGFFRLPESSDRLFIEIGEAGALVARSRDSYDLIVVDGYDARGRVGALDSLAFYRNCQLPVSRAGGCSRPTSSCAVAGSSPASTGCVSRSTIAWLRCPSATAGTR